MLDKQEVGKRGYLNEGFRLFRLKDSRAQQLDYHYHEFDKISIAFLLIYRFLYIKIIYINIYLTFGIMT